MLSATTRDPQEIIGDSAAERRRLMRNAINAVAGTIRRDITIDVCAAFKSGVQRAYVGPATVRRCNADQNAVNAVT